MNKVDPGVVWDTALIKKYNYSGPRYTSYPTALEFTEHYTEADFQQAISLYPERPLSLYIHIPFCHKLCYFCGCNKIVTRQSHKADDYLDILEQEIRHRAMLFQGRQVAQMHWGGGTPTFLTTRQISRLNQMLRQHFSFLSDAEVSLEIDPRELELTVLDHLRSEGFNRLSMGIQDFNPLVQQLVNREQDEAFIIALITRARELGFHSLNLDLIYGLPKQTRSTFTYTLEKVITLMPDRLSVFNYAHLPNRFAAQRKIRDTDLPSAEQRLSILQDTIHLLTQAGYQFIGMDHFARPDDELARAQRAGVLHRNFQGYTTHGECDLLGLGVSSISMLGDSYAQNDKDLVSYSAAIVRQGSALSKGLSMTADDCIRRDVIKELICNFQLPFAIVEDKYGISFADYFAEDLKLLQPFIADGLVEVSGEGIWVTATGRLLIRNICMCFDYYLRRLARQQQFSRLI